MRLLRFGLASCLVLLVACVGQVNVGGPLGDGGSGSGDGAVTSGNDSGSPPVAEASVPASDASSSVSEASATIDAGPDPSTGLQQARGYANGNVACNTNDDCCVVFDGCVNEALVVGVADKDKVASLLASFDAWTQTPGAPPTCTGCIPPPVEVSCVQGKCTGTIIDFKAADGGSVDAWFMNHCGSIPGSTPTTHTGSILGC